MMIIYKQRSLMVAAMLLACQVAPMDFVTVYKKTIDFVPSVSFFDADSMIFGSEVKSIDFEQTQNTLRVMLVELDNAKKEGQDLKEFEEERDTIINLLDICKLERNNCDSIGDKIEKLLDRHYLDKTNLLPYISECSRWQETFCSELS